MKKLTLVRILTVFIVTSAVILSYSSTVQGTPLFFDFLKRTFGGKGKAPKPASNQRPQGSAWATGGQYQKEKKFPWDIFGIFGYKNVIRPNNRPRPQRPGPPYRPPRFFVLHVKTYHIQTLCSKWEVSYLFYCTSAIITRSWIHTNHKDEQNLLKKNSLKKRFWPSKSGFKIYKPRFIIGAYGKDWSKTNVTLK